MTHDNKYPKVKDIENINNQREEKNTKIHIIMYTIITRHKYY